VTSYNSATQTKLLTLRGHSSSCSHKHCCLLFFWPQRSLINKSSTRIFRVQSTSMCARRWILTLFSTRYHGQPGAARAQGHTASEPFVAGPLQTQARCTSVNTIDNAIPGMKLAYFAYLQRTMTCYFKTVHARGYQRK
jgi:hypothetical protein